jgi:hypothetical protein
LIGSFFGQAHNPLAFVPVMFYFGLVFDGANQADPESGSAVMNFHWGREAAVKYGENTVARPKASRKDRAR